MTNLFALIHARLVTAAHVRALLKQGWTPDQIAKSVTTPAID